MAYQQLDCGAKKRQIHSLKRCLKNHIDLREVIKMTTRLRKLAAFGCAFLIAWVTSLPITPEDLVAEAFPVIPGLLAIMSIVVGFTWILVSPTVHKLFKQEQLPGHTAAAKVFAWSSVILYALGLFCNPLPFTWF
jgi:hypothetical protein